MRVPRLFHRALIFLAVLATPATMRASEDNDAFRAGNDVAMARMMAAMHAAPSGDVDRDFVMMMVPHHQGAIDMAMALLRHGRNERLKRLALRFVSDGRPLTSVSLFDQGLSQVLQAAATGLEPARPYVLALAGKPDGSGALQPLSAFKANPAGSAIVNAVGPIRQLVNSEGDAPRRYLVIAPGTPDNPGPPIQVQIE